MATIAVKEYDARMFQGRRFLEKNIDCQKSDSVGSKGL